MIQVGMLTALVLCRPHRVGNHSCWGFLCVMALLWPEDTVLSQFSLTSDSYSLSTLSSTGFLSRGGRNKFDAGVPFMVEYSIGTNSQFFDQL